MKEALKRALESMKRIDAWLMQRGYTGLMPQEKEVITAIKAALAQPEQEPVAWITPDGEGFRIRFSPPTNDVPLGWDALYTTPPQRTWVGLTHQETKDCMAKWDGIDAYVLCRAVEAKLKEKNT